MSASRRHRAFLLAASLMLTGPLAACSSTADPPATTVTPTNAVATTAGTAATRGSTPGSSPGSTNGPGNRPAVGSTPGSTSGATPGSAPGSAPGTAVRAGSCPDRNDLVIATRAGKKPLATEPGKADITLDQSAKMVIANYAVPDADVHGIFNPTNLTGDELALSIYLTSKTPLSATDYLAVGSNKDAPNQLNNIAAYSAAGREIVGGVAKPNQKATITHIDKTVVCGTIDTDEATGTWVARPL